MKLELSLRGSALCIAPSFFYPASPTAAVARRVFSLAFVLALLLATGPSVRAGDAAPALDIRLLAYRVVVDTDGRERLDDATDVSPGDVVQYTAVFVNRGETPMRELRPTLPIPEGTEFLGGSAVPSPAAASFDGQDFVPLPLQLVQASGDVVEPPPSSWRAVRWKLAELPPGAAFTISGRVVITAN